MILLSVEITLELGTIIIIAIALISVFLLLVFSSFGRHKKTISEKRLPYKPNWVSFTTYKEYKNAYPDLPERLLKSLANKQSPVAIVKYESLFTNELEELIVSAYSRKNQFDYDDTDPLRRKDGVNE